MIIDYADFAAKDFIALIQHHLALSNANICTHALGYEALQAPNIHMFTARHDDGRLMGCAALKILAPDMGEIKSVRTYAEFLRQGVSRALMAHIEQTARDLGIKALYLETHNTANYQAACRLYEALEYKICGPFGDYVPDWRSQFMRKIL